MKKVFTKAIYKKMKKKTIKALKKMKQKFNKS